MSDDLIKRSDAIKAVWGEDINPSEDGMVFEAQSHIDRDIRLIPSADRPRGEWIVAYNGNGWNDYWDCTCSNCGKKYERADAVLYKANFCPNCGARMRPKLQGTHFDSIIIDECAIKGADDE